jgi:hypothetical protein
MDELWYGLPVLRRTACTLNKSPHVFLNMFLPLRFENSEIGIVVDQVCSKNRPPD